MRNVVAHSPKQIFFFDWTKLVSLILIGGYLFYCMTHTDRWHIIDGANTVFHEAGHLILRFMGIFVGVLGGTLFQLAVPITCFISAWWGLKRFEASIIAIWIGQNLVNISVYMDDAIGRNLQLLGGDYSIHDWYYLFTHTNLLEKSHQIATVVHGLGFLVAIAGVLYALYYAAFDEGSVIVE